MSIAIEKEAKRIQGGIQYQTKRNTTNMELFLSAHKTNQHFWVSKMIEEQIDLLTQSQIHSLIESCLEHHDRASLDLLLKRWDPCSSKTIMGQWIHYATRHQQKTLLRMLLQKSTGFEASAAFKWAITHKRADMVAILAPYIEPILKQQNLLRAHELHAVACVEALVQNGTDINAHHGYLLVQSIKQRNTSLVYRLLSMGADPNIGFGAPMLNATRNMDVKLTEMLLRHGAVDTHCDTMRMDMSTRLAIQKWRKKHPWDRMRNALLESIKQSQFQWQVCARHITQKPSIANSYVSLLKRYKYLCQKLLYMVDPMLYHTFQVDADVDMSSYSSHRVLLRDLALMYDCLCAPYTNVSGSDLLGNDLCHVPKWKILNLDGRLFTYGDLSHMIVGHGRGYLLCPYTRTRLPQKYISDYLNLVQKVAMPHALNDTNIIHLVMAMPLMSKAMELRLLLMSILSRLIYVPPPELILNADADTIDDMVRNLFLLMVESYHIYPFIPLARKTQISNCQLIENKRELFIHLLRDIVLVQDDHTPTRIEAVSMVLRHYNVDGSTRNDEQDTLAWLLGLSSNSSAHSDQSSGDYMQSDHFDVPRLYARY